MFGCRNLTAMKFHLMKSIGKLSNYNFQLTKTSYQNNFKHMAFFFTLFQGYKCIKLNEITLTKRFLLELPKKTSEASNFTK